MSFMAMKVGITVGQIALVGGIVAIWLPMMFYMGVIYERDRRK